MFIENFFGVISIGHKGSQMRMVSAGPWRTASREKGLSKNRRLSSKDSDLNGGDTTE